VRHEAGGPVLVEAPNTAGEIMTKEVVSVLVGTSVRDVAILLLDKRISAIPVLAANLELVGMVSEGDLIGRSDADRVARRDWWLTLLKDVELQTGAIAALAARPVEQVMRAPVLTIEARAPLHEIAEMLKVYDIKRLPVMQGGRMVGIVSRSDLVRAVATQIPKPTMGESMGGLLSLFTGMMQTDVRPEDASASAVPAMAERPPVTAGSFRELVTIAGETARVDAVAAKQLAALERQRQIEAMRLEHLDKEVWAKLLDRAQTAATQGESSFELIRFPATSAATAVAKSTLQKLIGRRPSGAKRPRSTRVGSASFDRLGSGFVLKLLNIWTASQTISPCLLPGPLLNPAKWANQAPFGEYERSTKLAPQSAFARFAILQSQAAYTRA
jgi:CBS domain-containing protein